MRHYIAKKRSREEAMKLFRSLNPQEQTVVHEAMKEGIDSEILVTSFDGGGDSVQRGSMRTLCPGKWLNDEIINYFLKNCLKRRDAKFCAKEPGRRRSHFFNSFFLFRIFMMRKIKQEIEGGLQLQDG